MDYTYDPKKQKLVFTHTEHRYGLDKSTTLTIKATVYGLEAKIVGFYARQNECIWLPGQYDIRDIAKLLQRKFVNDETPYTYYSDALLETELWEARGFLVPSPRSFPAGMIEKIPLDVFVKSTLKNMKTWMREAIYSQNIFGKMTEDKITKYIRDGIFPERLHSVRNWHLLSFENILNAINSRAWKMKQWALFSSQCYELYKSVLNRHSIEAWDDIRGLMALALRMPKTPGMVELVHTIYQNGGELALIEPAQTLREAREIVQAWLLRREAEERAREAQRFGIDIAANGQAREPAPLMDYSKTLAGYIKPNIAVKKGWKWADNNDFWSLGTKYSCCISGGSFYSSRMANGQAHVLYREDPHDTKGALAYIALNGNSTQWYLQQIRSHANGIVADKFRFEAEDVVRQMNKSFDLKKEQKRRLQEAKKAKKKSKHQEKVLGMR